MVEIEGVPVTAETQVYAGRTTSADISPQIVEFLAQNPNVGFSESQLASALNYVDDSGKALQQRINGPINKLFARIEETGEQPEGIPDGYELGRFQQQVDGRMVKTWAVIEVS